MTASRRTSSSLLFFPKKSLGAGRNGGTWGLTVGDALAASSSPPAAPPAANPSRSAPFFSGRSFEDDAVITPGVALKV